MPFNLDSLWMENLTKWNADYRSTILKIKRSYLLFGVSHVSSSTSACRCQDLWPEVGPERQRWYHYSVSLYDFPCCGHCRANVSDQLGNDIFKKMVCYKKFDIVNINYNNNLVWWQWHHVAPIGTATARVARVWTLPTFGNPTWTRPILCNKVLIHYYLDPTIFSTPVVPWVASYMVSEQS